MMGVLSIINFKKCTSEELKLISIAVFSARNREYLFHSNVVKTNRTFYALNCV